MANRFPLIVNEVSKKIEELVSGDNLDLSGNNIIISSDTGSGKYLTSDGTAVSWGTPGDVYLTQTQTLTNKTLTSAIISGSQNTLSNIPNNALSNSSISVNGTQISLGGTVVTPNDNTTYAISATDGLNATQKIVRLTAGGSGTGTDDVTIAVGAPQSVPAGSNAVALEISRAGDVITIAGSAPDADTITTLQAAQGGAAQTGAMKISGSGSTTVTQNAATNTIDVSSVYVDTITRLRATSGQAYASGDFTFLATGATTVAQGIDGNNDPTITFDSTNTVTRVKGGTAGTLVSGDVNILGGTNVTVTQAGNDVTIASQDNDTVTRLASGSNAVTAGDFKIAAAGASTVTQATVGGVTTITVSSVNSDTGASLTASNGVLLSGLDFQLKNAANLTGNTVMKWDSGNFQLADSLITDNGSTVTIGGDLVVNGTQTILNTTTLEVEDNLIELRKGNNISGADGGIQLNRTTDGSGNTTAYQRLEWYESGAYWRSWDGSVSRRFVTEGETQTLTNKTLTSPICTNPSLGAAIATSVNGLQITSTASGVLSITSGKTLDVQRDVTLTTDNAVAAVSANLRSGGNVAYTSDTLATFASTTSTQLRGLISDTTGTGRLVFQTSPNILTSMITTSTGFTLFNTNATSITAFGAASAITMGAAGGDFTINQNLIVNEDLTVGASITDNILLKGTVNIDNADLVLFGTSNDPFKIGRGNSSVNTNIAIGHDTLANNSSGSQNIAIGMESQLTTNSGAANLSVGHRALRANGIGNDNIAIGRDCLLVSLTGEKNVAIGNNAMETLTGGNANVCIGYYAGYNVKGTGNVIIGPADDANQTNSTFEPPNVNGDRQLVIGSGTEAWLRGDANFDLTLNKDVTINNDCLIKGDLTVNGTTTTVKSNVVEVADKAIELAAVVSITFAATVTDGTANLTSITPTLGLIPGMEVQTSTGGITIPGGTTIVSITNNTAVLSNNVTGNGTAQITALGPSDTAAHDGGIIVKGTTDKKLTFKHQDGGVTYNTWVSSEHMDLADNKHYSINGIYIADENTRTIGPNLTGTGGSGSLTWTLGTALSLGSATATSLYIGNAGDVAPDGFASRIQVNASNHEGSIQIGRHTANSNGPLLLFNKTRSGSAAPSGTTALSRDDMLGGMRFFGADGTDDTCNAGGIQAYMDGDAASNSFPGRLEFLTTTGGSPQGSVKMTISENGVISTPTGSPLSYHATNGTYEIYTDAHNREIADSTSGFHVMKTWTAEKSGQFRLKFQAMIQSGSYYFIYDIYNLTQGKRINQNGTASAASDNGLNACRWTDYLAANETSSVHGMRWFNIKCGNNSGSYMGEVKPGDVIQLRMASSAANGTFVTGNGQNLRCEHVKIFSDTPGQETGGKNYNPCPAAFHAIMGGGNTSFSNGDDLTWGSTAFNRGYMTDSNGATVTAGFDTANNCFIVPYSGIYHFYINFFLNSTSDSRISLEIDGTAYTSGYLWGSNTSEGQATANQGGSQSLYLGAGAVIKVTVQSGAINSTYGGHTSWGGFLVG